MKIKNFKLFLFILTVFLIYGGSVIVQGLDVGNNTNLQNKNASTTYFSSNGIQSSTNPFDATTEWSSQNMVLVYHTSSVDYSGGREDCTGANNHDYAEYWFNSNDFQFTTGTTADLTFYYSMKGAILNSGYLIVQGILFQKTAPDTYVVVKDNQMKYTSSQTKSDSFTFSTTINTANTYMIRWHVSLKADGPWFGEGWSNWYDAGQGNGYYLQLTNVHVTLT